MIYIFWTAKDKEEAHRIVEILLAQRLIACASLIDGVESIYRWEGKIEKSREVKVIFKTVGKHFDPICHWIQKEGSYKVPEVTQLEVAKANPDYLSWLETETNSSSLS